VPSCEIKGIRDIHHYIQMFNTRTLTFDHDVLHAFSGILKAFEDAKYPVLHHWGTPIFPPIAEMNEEITFAKRTLSADFDLGLCCKQELMIMTFN
jgi:hypothetical protein